MTPTGVPNAPAPNAPAPNAPAPNAPAPNAPAPNAAAPSATPLPRGRSLLRDPRHNRGTAFTLEQRLALGLEGLLPPAVLTIEEQAVRAYEQYHAQPGDLARNSFLTALHDRNEVLYYRLLEEHLKEMLPIIYAPTVALAIQHYSHEFQRPNGVYLSVDRIGTVENALGNYGLGADDVDLLVATDGEAILGIGDWGANGMAISIGKLAVYTAAGGIHPGRVIPVMLDVGTDRESLLGDPLYVGSRHGRVGGERYDELIAAYIDACSRLFPHALLHFEDFGPANARRILEQYQDRALIFNDDMQGTGAITLAAILAAMRVARSRPSEQRVVIFGAGTAGIGIADQLRTVMIRDGLSEAEATRRFWCVDRQGLLTADMADLRDFQVPYARPPSEPAGWSATQRPIGLQTVVAGTRPTILVGTSTQGGAFTEPIVREMARHVDRPMIFPLSNPTHLIEAVPADLIEWTDGRALIGTGTPWEPVSHRGTDYEIAQTNNALIYPGIGQGTIVSRASRITNGMLLAAAEALAELVDGGRPGAALLPAVQRIRAASAAVAIAVARQAASEGIAQAELRDPVQAVDAAMWTAAYPPLEVP